MAKSKVTKTIKELVAQSTPDNPAFIPPDAAAELQAAGEIHIHPTLKDDAGNVAVASAAAVGNVYEVAPAFSDVPDVTGVADSTGQYEIIGGLDFSAKSSRGGHRAETYPFSKLEIGQSFLVPCTAAYPEPWKTFQSTVTSANRRFAVKATDASGQPILKPSPKVSGRMIPVWQYNRKFELHKVSKGDRYANGYVEQQDGARVVRVK